MCIRDSNGLAGDAVELNAFRRQFCHFSVLEIDDVFRMADQSGDVGGKIVFTDADAQDEGAELLGGEDMAGVIGAQSADGLAALQAGDGLHQGLFKIPLIVIG